MRRLLIVLFVLLAPLAAEARKGGPFGLGVLIGDPSGLNAKVFLGGNNAFDVGVGWSLRSDVLHIHADYLFHFPQRWGGGEWLPFVGIGGVLGLFRNDAGIGVRVPFGLSWFPAGGPVDIFAEIAPGVSLIPGTHFDLYGGIGARFFF